MNVDTPPMVLAAPRRAEARVLASRFIATACPVMDASSARAVIASVQAEFPDATHHCWAWRLVDDGEERTHDADEPAGTAGPPILQAIRSAGLSGLVVVVSRYFGGTKLGKGGLARAYRDVARAALSGAPATARRPEVDRVVLGPIAQDGPMRHLLSRWGARVIASEYGAVTVTLSVRVPLTAADDLRAALETLTRGAARFGPVPPPRG